MEVTDAAKPASDPLVRGRLLRRQNLRYVSRTLELYDDGWLYVYLDGMDNPQSKIHVSGCTIANNSDDPLGFTLTSRDQKHKQKFICPDAESKQKWLDGLHRMANRYTDAVTRNVRFMGVDRSEEPIIAASLLKRSGRGSYGVRWVEVRRKVGLAYSKRETDPDDDFKVIPLDGADIVVNDEKMRITIIPQVDRENQLHLRMNDTQQFVRWVSILEHEAGSDWETLSAADATGGEDALNETRQYGGRPSQGELEVDSDDELEMADLESAEPLRFIKVASYLESISREVRADRDTPGFETVLQRALDGFGQSGFVACLDSFEEDMAAPLLGPYRRLREHVADLDADAKHIRLYLTKLLDAYPRELKLVVVAQRANDALLAYTRAREMYKVRQDMAEFCETKRMVNGTMSVNDMLSLVKRFCRDHKPEEAHRHEAEKRNIAKLSEHVRRLQEVLHEFRLDYDFFDDAYYPIHSMETGVRIAKTWLDTAKRAQREATI